MTESMKALPVDWLAKAVVNDVEYAVDLSYNIWNLATEEKIYHEAGTGEIDLRDVINDREFWKDSSDQFTLKDFLVECLNLD